jgi:hypothetical protein
MFFAVAKLAALQRADVIAKLDDQVAHGSTDEAKDAVRNLATIPRPPLALLVKAAASPNLNVAREAQQAIDEYLRFCQREVKAGKNVKLVARQLAVLAEALAIEQHVFSVVDYPWLESTTRKVLRLANRIPSRTTPLVAARCDEILAAISADRSTANSPSAATPTKDETLLTGVSPPADAGGHALGGAKELTALRPDQQLAALAARPWSDAPAGSAISAGIAGPEQPTPTIVDAHAQQFSVTFQPPVASGPSTGLDVGDDALAGVLSDGPSESGWKAQWTHPILRSLPALPINAAPSSGDGAGSETDGPRAGRSNTPRRVDAADQRFEGVDSRKLLARWLVAEGADVYPLEQELTERGFGRLSARLVRQLFSERVEDRLRLVDDVLNERGVDARPWLSLLAEDENGDVRLLAVTIMATSNDPDLIEKAWQVAIRDRDPRIAGLAERLRERRGGARRR